MNKSSDESKANISKGDDGLNFEGQLGAAADKMRGHMDASEYMHVCVGLSFLKYISDAFEVSKTEPWVVWTKSSTTTSTFAASKVILLPQEVFDRFEKAVSPMFTRILSNIQESRTLAVLRDALLSKSLSGELRVAEAEERAHNPGRQTV